MYHQRHDNHVGLYQFSNSVSGFLTNLTIFDVAFLMLEETTT